MDTLELNLSELCDEWTALPPSKYGYDINIDTWEFPDVIRVIAYPLVKKWYNKYLTADTMNGIVITQIDTTQ